MDVAVEVTVRMGEVVVVSSRSAGWVAMIAVPVVVDEMVTVAAGVGGWTELEGGEGDMAGGNVADGEVVGGVEVSTLIPGAREEVFGGGGRMLRGSDDRLEVLVMMLDTIDSVVIGVTTVVVS